LLLLVSRSAASITSLLSSHHCSLLSLDPLLPPGVTIALGLQLYSFNLLQKQNAKFLASPSGQATKIFPLRVTNCLDSGQIPARVPAYSFCSPDANSFPHHKPNSSITKFAIVAKGAHMADDRERDSGAAHFGTSTSRKFARTDPLLRVEFRAIGLGPFGTCHAKYRRKQHI
jgi:hypothetical protein